MADNKKRKFGFAFSSITTSISIAMTVQLTIALTLTILHTHISSDTVTRKAQWAKCCKIQDTIFKQNYSHLLGNKFHWILLRGRFYVAFGISFMKHIPKFGFKNISQLTSSPNKLTAYNYR